MSSFQVREKKEQSLTEQWFFRFLMGLIVIICLFFVANHYLNNIYDEVEEYRASLMSDRFVKSVGHIHQQWNMLGKTKVIKLDYYETSTTTKKIVVSMSKKGWPLNVEVDLANEIVSSELDCATLWTFFAESEEDRSETTDIIIAQEENACRFSWALKNLKHKTLRYDAVIGKISLETELI